MVRELVPREFGIACFKVGQNLAPLPFFSVPKMNCKMKGRLLTGIVSSLLVFEGKGGRVSDIVVILELEKYFRKIF